MSERLNARLKNEFGGLRAIEFPRRLGRKRVGNCDGLFIPRRGRDAMIGT
jgi:hypothetical protein